MPVTSYYSVGGEILGERTDGGGRTNYGVDALGSVTSTLVGDAVVNRYSYKPYGAELSRSGAGADPSFRWVGSLGYRSTGRSRSEQYVRARHYDAKGGRWSTVDPLWPEEPQYGYVKGKPMTLLDPSGMQSLFGPSCKWVPLTMAALYDAYYTKYRRMPSSRQAADVLESCGLKALGKTKYRGRSFPSTWRRLQSKGRYKGVVPDAVDSLNRIGWGMGTIPNSVFIEVKGKTGSLGIYDSDGQIGGMLDWLSGYSPVAQESNDCVPLLVLATTSGVTIAGNIVDASQRPARYFSLGRKPVAVFWSTSFIKKCCVGQTWKYTDEVYFEKPSQINATGTTCRQSVIATGGRCTI